MPEPGDRRVNRITTASMFMKLGLVGHKEEYAGICSVQVECCGQLCRVLWQLRG